MEGATMTLDLLAVHLALRNRALAVSVTTTGLTSLAATTTGYTRVAGSFIADGFQVGMELLAAGFAGTGNAGYKVVLGVSAGTLTVRSLPDATMATEAATGDEILTVGLPILRAY